MKSTKTFLSLLLLCFVFLLYPSTLHASYVCPYTEPSTLVKIDSTGNCVKWVQDLLNQLRIPSYDRWYFW